MIYTFIVLLLGLGIMGYSYSMEEKKQSPKTLKKASSAPSDINNNNNKNLRESFKKAQSANELYKPEHHIYVDSPCGGGRRRSATSISPERDIVAPEKPDLRNEPPSKKN